MSGVVQQGEGGVGTRLVADPDVTTPDDGCDVRHLVAHLVRRGQDPLVVVAQAIAIPCTQVSA